MSNRRPAAAAPTLLLAVALSLGACSAPSPGPSAPPTPPGNANPGGSAPALGAPRTLGATATQGGILLTWTPPEGGASGYRVGRSDRADGPFATLATLGAASTQYLDTGAPAGQRAFYEVVALGPQGASAPATAAATRPARPGPGDFAATPIAAQPYGVSEAQGVALGAQLYTFGGFDVQKLAQGQYTPTDRAYRYDPAANTWTPIAPMPQRGGTHVGITTDGTHVFLAGGYVANGDWTYQVFGTRAVWRYDPQSNQYFALPELPEERAGGQLQYLDGKLHYFGGNNIAREDVGDHFVLDLAGGAAAWTRATPMPNPRSHLGSAVLGGRIYAIGGQHGHDDMAMRQTEVDAYDPAKGAWTRVADLLQPRSHMASAVFVQDGRLWIAGGETAQTGQPVTNLTMYDPAANAWTDAAGVLPEPRMGGVAAAIGTGFVYTAGNNAPGGWRFTPKTGY